MNYNKYFVEGEEQISGKEDYTSNNTRILGVEEIKEVLLRVGYIKKELATNDPGTICRSYGAGTN